MAAGGRTRQEQDLEFLERQEISVSCLFCKWHLRALAPTALEKQRHHFEHKHGLVRGPKRARRSLNRISQYQLDADEWAIIDAERRRRARTTGVELE
jgi:hypothetical protein